MTNSPRGDEPTQSFSGRLDGRPGDAYSGYPGHSGYPDPAYAGPTPYGPRPTEPIPAYPAYDPAYATNQYYGAPPPPPGGPTPPEGPRTPRWLWVVAAIAIIVVLGLVIALVIVNSSQQDTVVAPVPSLSEPAATPTPSTTRRPSTTSTTAPSLAPLPSTSAPTTSGTEPGVTETVVYNVSGTGRAINITYVDTGGVLQTEFNVMLPWSKQVDLAKPAKGSASVSIINVGREVSCSISIDGAQVQQRSGSGLTICSPIG
ncbi:MmpS family transport accessory protein [Mycolicibacterium sp. Y3]